MNNVHYEAARRKARSASQEEKRAFEEVQAKANGHDVLPAASTNTEVAATVIRLAGLAPLDYEHVREAEAKRLSVRVQTLDQEVERKRRELNGATQSDDHPNDHLQGSGAQIAQIEPWAAAVDIAEVLDECVNLISMYVPMAESYVHAVALWIVHAHAFDAFHKTPRLNIRSPEKNCGKSTLLDVIAALSQRALALENLSTAVFFRLIDEYAPTVLVDEIDRSIVAKEELVGALNSGHKRGAQFARCEGDDNKVRLFRVFAPVVLAGIGDLPGTLSDRSIVINLTRAKRGEIAKRFDSRHTEPEHQIASKFARWVADHRQQLQDADPDMGELFNRLADNWRPLFAVADLAGGRWPALARAAANALSGGEPDADSIRVELLVDIKTAFDRKPKPDGDRFTTEELISELTKDPTRPWCEFGKMGKAITSRQLAWLLRPFNIVPGSIRMADGKTPKGYLREKFEGAFARFIPIAPLCDSPQRHMPTLPGDVADSRSATEESVLRIANPPQASTGAVCGGVADRKAGIDGLREYEAVNDLFREPGADETEDSETSV